MRRATLILVFGAISTTSLHAGKYCPQACEAVLGYITFNDTDAGLSRKVRQCRSEMRITSIYLCFEAYCRSDDGEPGKWIDDQARWCLKHADNVLPDYHDVIDPWTPDRMATIRRFNSSKALLFPTFDNIAIPDERFFDAAFATLGTTIGHRFKFSMS
jgi:hypothetical protein